MQQRKSTVRQACKCSISQFGSSTQRTCHQKHRSNDETNLRQIAVVRLSYCSALAGEPQQANMSSRPMMTVIKRDRFFGLPSRSVVLGNIPDNQRFAPERLWRLRTANHRLKVKTRRDLRTGNPRLAGTIRYCKIIPGNDSWSPSGSKQQTRRSLD
jgi:hypothetical protein